MAMRPEAVELFKRARALHEEAVRMCLTARNDAKKCADTEELADLAFACRKTCDFLTETMKLVRQLGVLSEKIAATVHIATCPNQRSIHTQYVVATPNVKVMASIPRPDSSPKEYAEMMEFFGVPENLWKGRTHALVKDHWPGVMEELTRLQAEGKPLPPGLDPEKSYAEYTLTLTGRKGPDE
jgi:hypothetical protein